MSSGGPALRAGERGQALAVVAGGMLALLAMIALIIDGGNAFAEQRTTQNGADAASEAGTVVLARKLAGVTAVYVGDVYQAVTASAAANGLTVGTMEFTDVNGTPLASNAAIGNLNHGAIPAGAAGVHVKGTRTFRTYVGGVIGLGQLQAGAEATAITGYQASPCDSATGCGVIPIAVPVNASDCVDPNTLDLSVMQASQPWPVDTLVSIPICGTAAGNVGWLDFNGRGISGVADSILHPANPAIAIPSWVNVAQAGDTSSSQIQNALDTYAGSTLLAPMFLHVCGDEVTGTRTQLTDCPGHLDADAGGGTWIQYYVVAVSPFQLCGPSMNECNVLHLNANQSGAFINKQSTLCNDLQRGGKRQNGPVNCLIGLFRSQYITGGTVDRNYGSQYPSVTHQVVVQLIK